MVDIEHRRLPAWVARPGVGWGGPPLRSGRAASPSGGVQGCWAARCERRVRPVGGLAGRGHRAAGLPGRASRRPRAAQQRLYVIGHRRRSVARGSQRLVRATSPCGCAAALYIHRASKFPVGTISASARAGVRLLRGAPVIRLMVGVVAVKALAVHAGGLLGRGHGRRAGSQPVQRRGTLPSAAQVAVKARLAATGRYRTGCRLGVTPEFATGKCTRPC